MYFKVHTFYRFSVNFNAPITILLDYTMIKNALGANTCPVGLQYCAANASDKDAKYRKDSHLYLALCYMLVVIANLIHWSK